MDSTDFEEIKRLNQIGIIDGLTTNPSLIYKAKTPFDQLINNLCSEIKGPVSVETVAENSEQMINEGIKISKMAKNIVVKLPMTWEGIKSLQTTFRNVYKNKCHIMLFIISGNSGS